jgi:hypothetical protein
MALDDLDRERTGPLVASLSGQRVVVSLDPAQMNWRRVAACVSDVKAFINSAQLGAMSLAQADLLRAAWVAHYGLTPDEAQTRRLAHAMDRYSDQLEADFPRWYPGIGPADMWRARKWRALLNLIDHLPQNTHYQNALAKDPEHAARIAEHRAQHPEQETDASPPWYTWSPELAKLTDVLDQLKIISYRIAATNGATGVEKPKMDARPKSELSKAMERMKWRKHEALAARMLRNRRSRAD